MKTMTMKTWPRQDKSKELESPSDPDSDQDSTMKTTRDLELTDTLQVSVYGEANDTQSCDARFCACGHFSHVMSETYVCLTSGCCNTLRVLYDKSNTVASHVKGGNRIFTTFKIDTFNGRIHYTSKDGLSAISYCEHGGGQWLIMVTNDYTSLDAGYGKEQELASEAVCFTQVPCHLVTS